MAAASQAATGGGAGPLFDEPNTAAAQTAVPQLAISWLPIAAVAALVLIGLWAVWVTRELVSKPEAAPIARIQLSAMVGEYVQAQARSATPPEQVTAETKAFMAEIEKNLRARGVRGQIVLVGEAVLAGNVPDITADVRRQVFSKIRMPQPAPHAASSVMGAMQQAMADPALAGTGNGPRN